MYFISLAGVCLLFFSFLFYYDDIIRVCSLEVFVDAANTGEWESCVSVPELDLPEFWASRAYIGMTATTGQLADNHDIISLKTYSDQAVLEADEEKEKVCSQIILC